MKIFFLMMLGTVWKLSATESEDCKEGQRFYIFYNSHVKIDSYHCYANIESWSDSGTTNTKNKSDSGMDRDFCELKDAGETANTTNLGSLNEKCIMEHFGNFTNIRRVNPNIYGVTNMKNQVSHVNIHLCKNDAEAWLELSKIKLFSSQICNYTSQFCNLTRSSNTESVDKDYTPIVVWNVYYICERIEEIYSGCFDLCDKALTGETGNHSCIILKDHNFTITLMQSENLSCTNNGNKTWATIYNGIFALSKRVKDAANVSRSATEFITYLTRNQRELRNITEISPTNNGFNDYQNKNSKIPDKIIYYLLVAICLFILCKIFMKIYSISVNLKTLRMMQRSSKDRMYLMNCFSQSLMIRYLYTSRAHATEEVAKTEGEVSIQPIYVSIDNEFYNKPI